MKILSILSAAALVGGNTPKTKTKTKKMDFTQSQIRVESELGQFDYEIKDGIEIFNTGKKTYIWKSNDGHLKMRMKNNKSFKVWLDGKLASGSYNDLITRQNKKIGL